MMISASWPSHRLALSFGQFLQSGLDRNRRALAYKLVDRARGGWPRLPLPIIPFLPEDIFKAVRDRKAAVLCTFGDDALGPQMHGDVRPIVITGNELVPLALQLLLPELVLRDEPPKRCHREHHTVVEHRIPERCEVDPIRGTTDRWN